MIKPMLARVYDEKTKFYDGELLHLQPKLNGHRCIITKTERGIQAFSRTGKEINSIQHILSAIEDSKLPLLGSLDGELYIHGVELQDLSSLIRRNQHDSKLLTYVMYDKVEPMDYRQRYHILDTLCKIINHPSVRLVEDTMIRAGMDVHETIAETRDQYIDQGYEGLMIRRDAAFYKQGVRSPSLYKAKTFQDAEFVVRDITASKDQRGAWAILHCDGFTVSAPGTLEEKVYILEHIKEYIGRKITVKYYGYTKNKIPVFPVAMYWRNDD